GEQSGLAAVGQQGGDTAPGGEGVVLADGEPGGAARQQDFDGHGGTLPSRVRTAAPPEGAARSSGAGLTWSRSGKDGTEGSGQPGALTKEPKRRSRSGSPRVSAHSSR